MGKSVKMSFVGKNLQEMGNGLKIDDSEKNLDPRGLSAPIPGQYTCLLPNYIKNSIEMAICYFHLFHLLLLIL